MKWGILKDVTLRSRLESLESAHRCAKHSIDTVSLQILNRRIENLKKKIEEGKKQPEFQGSISDDPVWCAEREVEEIESFLPEIVSKLEDSKEMQTERADGPKEQVISQMLDRTPETSPVKKVISFRGSQIVF